jgi:hypothetical protein
MAVELDHFSICTILGAPEAERLIEFGLSEGSPNHHPGQGTANRRFFFQNAFLELLWVEDAAEVQSERVRRTGLWERWSRRGRDASPFGIGFRPVPGMESAIPFSAWEYRPPYLPDPLAIHMASNSERVAEPLLFLLAFGRRPNPADPARRQPRDHAAGLRAITRLQVGIRQSGGPSPELRAAEESCGEVSFFVVSEPFVEVGFDDEKKGLSVDFRPQLPLLLRW